MVVVEDVEGEHLLTNIIQLPILRCWPGILGKLRQFNIKI